MHLGEHVTLMFEDELTMRYQIQEMLRIEKTFEEAGIQDELDAYNPLVPDGTNFKATMLIEYEDVERAQAALARLKGIEDRVWVQVEGCPQRRAIADEDLDARKRREDLGRAFPALRARRRRWSPRSSAARRSASASITRDTRRRFRRSPATREALVADLA